MTRREILAVARPILFNTEMVKAILDDRKTATRRVVKAPYYIDNADVCQSSGTAMHKGTNGTHGMPYPDSVYRPGDFLYVRETWRPVSATVDFWENGDPTAIGDGFGFQYRADGEIVWCGDFNPQNDEFHTTEIQYDKKWRPSIHMPKEAARIFLQVTEVRAKQLQNITDEQILKEGIRAWSKDGKLYKYAPADSEGDAPAWPWAECPHSPKGAMKRLWDSTIKPADLSIYDWDANPWVFVLEFERVMPKEVH